MLQFKSLKSFVSYLVENDCPFLRYDDILIGNTLYMCSRLDASDILYDEIFIFPELWKDINGVDVREKKNWIDIVINGYDYFLDK